MKADSDLIRVTLKNFFGYDSFKGEQEKIIKHLTGGGDCFVLMPTGGGKSLSQLWGISTDVRFPQFLKAPVPTDSVPAGITTLSRALL